MVLLLVAFAAGIVIGVAGLTTAFRAGKADFIWRGMGGGGRGMMGGGPGGGMGAWVAKELDVKAEKRDSIVAIYKRGSAAIDSIVQGNISAPMDPCGSRCVRRWKLVACRPAPTCARSSLPSNRSGTIP